MHRGHIASTVFAIAASSCAGFAEPVEIFCSIRPGGANLACQTTGKEKRVMNSEDIINFVDAGQVAAYLTLQSKKRIIRTFMIDPKALQYRRLSEMKRAASVSEIAKSKSDLFTEIERKVIKASDELDAQITSAELVLWDPRITYEKARRDQRALESELETCREGCEKVCAAKSSKK